MGVVVHIKKGIMLILFILLPYSSFCSDSLIVDFQSGFHHDSVTFSVNGNLVFQGILTTNVIAGIAESITLPKTANKYYDVVIQSKGCISTFRCRKKWKHIGISFKKVSCSFSFKLSKNEFHYL